jgi:hypothetical protein
MRHRKSSGVAMTTRGGYWLGGVAVAIGLSCMVLAVARGPGCINDELALALYGGFISMAVMGEIVSWIKAARSRPPEPSRDDSPADGVVEIVPVPTMFGAPNARDARFRRLAPTGQLGTPSPIRRKRPSRRQPPLLGRVAVASLFLGRDGKSWDDAEIARTLQCVIRAGEWIEQEAVKRGARVNICLPDLYFEADDPEPSSRPSEITILPEGDRDGLFDAGAELRLVASASRAARDLGFRDTVDLSDRVCSSLRCDALVWLVHPRSAGRSFVVPEVDTGLSGVSLAACFAREDDFPGPLIGPPSADPATFAHELLHLFGASDKYGVPLSAFPAGTVTDRDVMRMEFDRLKQLRIDGATATEIGWIA